MKKYIILLLFILLILSGCGLKSTKVDNSNKIVGGFEKYALANFQNLIFLNEVERRCQNCVKKRDVIGDNSLVVSVDDGYKFLYDFSDGTPFAKVHVEKSVSGKFLEDKNKLDDYMTQLFSEMKNNIEKTKKNNSTEYTMLFGNNDAIDFIEEEYKDITLKGWIINSFETGGQISNFFIFFPKDEIIMTIYFPNYYSNKYNPNKDIFKNVEDFKKFAKDFMYKIINSANTQQI